MVPVIQCLNTTENLPQDSTQDSGCYETGT